MPEIAIPTPHVAVRSRPHRPDAKLRGLLREATAGDHARLDAQLGALDLCTIAGYRRFLETASIEEFAGVLGGRIQALARAHDQITNLNWAPAALKSLVESEAGAYLAVPGRAASSLEDPDVALIRRRSRRSRRRPRDDDELRKYGALADFDRQVEIVWKFDQSSSLVIDWKESGGPPVQPPSRRGFGTTIIERSIPFDLNGDAELRFDLLGVQAHFVIPANYVEMVTSGQVSAESRPRPRRRRGSRARRSSSRTTSSSRWRPKSSCSNSARATSTPRHRWPRRSPRSGAPTGLRTARLQPRPRDQHSRSRHRLRRTRNALHVRHRTTANERRSRRTLQGHPSYRNPTRVKWWKRRWGS